MPSTPDAPRSVRSGRPRARRALTVLALATTATVLVGCLPAKPAAGRPGPVRRVALIGDSLTWGLFGTSPTVESPLRAKLAASGISLSVDGGPGDTIPVSWPGRFSWADQLQARIDRDDPDVVVIQSVLFVDADQPQNQAAYRAAAIRLLDIAQSRGAHVYFVRHHRPTNATERRAADVAEAIQADVAKDRGVELIPLEWWLARCRGAFLPDGWHLSGNGVECWANAANAAVNQLRNAVG